MHRRTFLTMLAAGTALPQATWADAGNPALLAAARDRNGDFALYGLSARGQDIFRIALPTRGHAAAVHPTAPEAVAFARRPGTFALVIDCASGDVAARLEAPRGRHFYGHGAFIEGGDILCTTENAIDSGEGRIGLWARGDGWRRIGEMPTHGIGPHEVVRLPGDILAVANGGIRTHPDHGREKLNLDTMRPSLVYLGADGRLLEQVMLSEDLRHCSIRHLAAANGTVAFAMQWQGDTAKPVPLLGLHRRGEDPVLCEPPLVESLAMQGYAGSVAFDGAGARVAITSPRGGLFQIFDTKGQFLQSLRRPDVCGIAPADEGFLVTDGLGGVFGADRSLHALASSPRAWDNHLVAMADLV
ncbi:DUF1513 domain-containing protein [Roseovarius pacificus]|uniref:DUF1513 domain-containing protein n=1 Tax=Roseovarius pacificus TaxID=337701 RepID=UPI00403A5E8A